MPEEDIIRQEVKKELNKASIETILGSLLAVGGALLFVPDLPKDFPEYVNTLRGLAGSAGIGFGLGFVHHGTRRFCEQVADIYNKLKECDRYISSIESSEADQ